MKYTKARYLRSANTALGTLVLLLLVITTGCGNKSDKEVKDVQLNNAMDSFSYAYGLLIAEHAKDKTHWDGINHKAFRQAIMETLKTDSARMMNAQDAKTLLEAYDATMATRYVAAIMEENKSEKGINVTPSGMQYKVISEGKGDLPQLGDSVEFHYDINLHGEPTRWSSREMGKPDRKLFSKEIMLPGIDEALGMMKAGSEWELTLPPSLAFGEKGFQDVPPYSIVEVKLTLIEVYKNN